MLKAMKYWRYLIMTNKKFDIYKFSEKAGITVKNIIIPALCVVLTLSVTKQSNTIRNKKIKK